MPHEPGQGHDGMDSKSVGDHFREVTKMITYRDLLEMEFSEQEIADLREIFSRNDTKCMDFDQKVEKTDKC